MSASVYSLFRSLKSHLAPARTRRVRLGVESLEQRDVPTAHLAPAAFTTPIGALHVATENPRTGAILGTFVDTRTGLDLAVHGQVRQLDSHLDAVTFHGTASKRGAVEQLTFAGKLQESTASILGALTATERLADRHVTSVRLEVHARSAASFVKLVAGDHRSGFVSQSVNSADLNRIIAASDPVTLKYEALGGAKGFLGATTTPVETTTDGVGEFQYYQNGVIFYAPFSGAHEVHGAILAKYEALGTANFGYPTTDETTTPDGIGRYNHFVLPGGQVAAIDWTPATGAHEIHGALATYFAQQGWENLGEVTTDQINLTATGAAYNRVERSIVFGMLRFTLDYTSAAGSSLVPGTSYTDVVQGAANTCWIDASIAELEYTDSLHATDVSQQITPLGNDLYSVALFNVNDVNNHTTAGYHPETQLVYFDGSTNSADPQYDPPHPSTSWAVIMQRAVIQAVSEWDPSQNITNPHSGGAADAIQILTGRESQSFSAQDQNIQQEIGAPVQAGQNVLLDTKGRGTATLEAFHYYAVLSTSPTGITMYNPHGSPITVSWSVINQDGSSFVVN
jgi:hypothetical protein